MADEKKDDGKPISFDFLTAGAPAAAPRAAPTAAEQAQGVLHGAAAEERCRAIAAQVNRELPRPQYNLMKPCRGELEFPQCRPLRVEEMKPLIFVLWGDSVCDCVEGDDTEIMSIVVCNPYNNVVLSHFTINRVVVVKSDGSAVPNLPDGSPAIQLVPLGPYCFDDIPACTCVWRQFSVRLRGVPAGDYRILLQGVCFEVCFHELREECFTFRVCKD
jgi:hypothetical protein